MRKIVFAIIFIFILAAAFRAPTLNIIKKIFSGEKKRQAKTAEIKKPDKKCDQSILEAQDILEKMGFYEGEVDGIDGPQTRRAMSAFQKKKKIKPTGVLDAKTKLLLGEEKLLHSFSDVIIPIPQENVYLDDVSSQADKKVKAQDEVLSYRLRSKDRLKKIQLALKEAGLYKGNIDGVEGPQTKEAIRAFQKSKGLNPDGIVGLRTWEDLSEYIKN